MHAYFFLSNHPKFGSVLEGNEKETFEEQFEKLAVKRATTSIRETSEWGIRVVQSLFSCPKDTIVYEEHGERRQMFTHLFFIYNLQACLVGINQM